MASRFQPLAAAVRSCQLVLSNCQLVLNSYLAAGPELSDAQAAGVISMSIAALIEAQAQLALIEGRDLMEQEAADSVYVIRTVRPEDGKAVWVVEGTERLLSTLRALFNGGLVTVSLEHHESGSAPQKQEAAEDD